MNGSRRTTRTFAAGAYRFAVETSHDDDRQLIESLFADLPEPADPPRFTVTFIRSHHDGELRWTPHGPRLEQQPELPLVEALNRLMSAVNLCALDLEPECLHLHAAAATLGDRAVIIAAPRNTGKTTTVAHLVDRGFGFVTDEMVRLPADDDRIGGFPKPLSVKPGGEALVDRLSPWMIPGRHDETESFRFVPMGASGAVVSTGGSPGAVVLLRRPNDATVPREPAVRTVHPADAVVALMQDTLDAERFGPAAERLARLVASTPCHEVTIGTPEATAAAIAELMDGDPPPVLPVTVRGPAPGIRDGVTTIAIDDRVVIHHAGTGTIFALDGTATMIWEQLGGWHDHGIDLAGPGARDFVTQLASLDVVDSERIDAVTSRGAPT